MHWAPLCTWTVLAAATAATARLALDHGKLALVDTATASALASSTFTSDHPNPLPPRELGDTDSLKLSFTLSRDGQPFVPQQAAVLVQPVNEHDRAPGRHWTSPAKVRASTGKAKWELDLSTAPPQLLSLASFAPLSFTLLVGHPHEDAPLALALGTFSLPASLALPHPYPPVHDLPAHWEAERYAKMPTIEWTFRGGEKRVNGVVALVATAVVLAPWLVLLATLTPLVPSLRLSRPSTLSLPLLLVSLALFEALFVAYWLRLSLFDAAPLAAALALVAALVGRGALGELLGRRRDAERREMGKTQ
ncbi:uncharacterized protein JCM10292_003279 [Rhodotorula paludigena]|uniref:uncharacterized protein n=1 Tax=Rhodotorula paludigena TaxID=86838 RepID=UPI003177CE27